MARVGRHVSILGNFGEVNPAHPARTTKGAILKYLKSIIFVIGGGGRPVCLSPWLLHCVPPFELKYTSVTVLLELGAATAQAAGEALREHAGRPVA